jgi:hypothetical protein
VEEAQLAQLAQHSVQYRSQETSDPIQRGEFSEYVRDYQLLRKELIKQTDPVSSFFCSFFPIFSSSLPLWSIGLIS